MTKTKTPKTKTKTSETKTSKTKTSKTKKHKTKTPKTKTKPIKTTRINNYKLTSTIGYVFTLSFRIMRSGRGKLSVASMERTLAMPTTITITTAPGIFILVIK